MWEPYFSDNKYLKVCHFGLQLLCVEPDTVHDSAHFLVKETHPPLLVDLLLFA